MTAASARAASAPSPRRRLAGAIVPSLAAIALSACAQTGDFGRKNPNVVNDEILPTAGAALAYARGEPVSRYRQTDDEREMQDLAWGVVMPPLETQWRQRVLAELRRTRILPADYVRIDRENYVRNLLSAEYRSSVARYKRLKEDVVADTYRIEPFFQAAARVDADDRVRRRALDGVPDVTADERQNALARIEENGLMIAWTKESFEDRLAAYRYALDRLILETPDRASMEVADAIDAYADVLGSLRPLGPARGIFKS